MMKFFLDKNSHVPLYQQIRKALERHICDKGIAPGEALPTLTEISKAACVSIHTVQNALQELLDEGICHRSGSRRLILGRSPVNNRSVTQKRDVIIICHQMGKSCVYTDSIAMRMLAGLQSEVTNRADVEIVMAGIPLEGSLKFCIENPCMNILGVVLLHWHNREQLVNIAREFPGIKFMHVNYALHDLESLPQNVFGIYNDDFAGGYQGAEFLLSHNVRHPAFFELTIPPNNDTYALRRKGFLGAVNNQGINGLVYTLPANIPGLSYGKRIGNHKEFFARIITEHPEIDGVLTCYDPMAEAIGEYLLQNGLDKKIMLLGYDGYMEINTCEFSGIGVDFYAMGQKAVQFLAQPEDKPRFQRVLPQLVIRNAGLVQSRARLLNAEADSGAKAG